VLVRLGLSRSPRRIPTDQLYARSEQAATYAHGLALALPEKVVMARPTGFERGHALSGFRQILIEAADEWRLAARESQ